MVWGQCQRPAPPLVGKGERRQREEGDDGESRKKAACEDPGKYINREKREWRGLSDGERDRLFIQLLLSFHHQLSLSPLFHPPLPLSAVSNEWQ